LKKSLEETKNDLRQERKNNMELIAVIEKLHKKNQLKDLEIQKLKESKREEE